MLNIENKWKECAKNKNKIEDFLDWFNSSENLFENVGNGYIDFYNRITNRNIFISLGKPFEKTCLEIGSGGGRLLIPAAKIFKQCYGIDIVNEDEEIKNRIYEHLHSFQTLNVQLITREYDLEPVDFIYSFIVFQHFKDITETINTINS